MKLFAAGLSHKTAPVELRERLAVKQSEIANLAFVLQCFGHLDEIVLLSTCNRVAVSGAIWIRTLIGTSAPLRCVTGYELPPVWTRWCSVKLKSPAKSKAPMRSLATPD